MAGFDNDVMYAKNVDFTNGFPVTRQVTAAGQLLIGTGNLAPLPEIAVGTLTAGAGISIVNGPGTITISLAGGGTGIDEIGVQAFTAPGTNPVVATGAGLITINGASVAAFGTPVRSNSIAANTLQIEVQRASAAGASAAANAGLSSFSSAQFSVDANGFVTNLNGLGASAFDVDANTAPGTDPVVPNASGVVGVSGLAVAAAGIPIRTNSVAANAYRIEVQRSINAGGSVAANAGLASFSNAAFGVDANGFVTLLGGGQAATNFTVDAFTGPGTNPVVPNVSGNISVTGTQVAAGTNPIRTNSIAANAYQIQVQRSQATGVSTLTANGICHFNSAQFTVDANGFVSSISGTAPWLESAGGALANHTGYYANAAAVYTLPAGVANGDMIEIVDFIGGGVVVTAQGGDEIRIGNVASSVNGTATSTQTGDALRLVFRLASQTWVSVPSAAGVWILA